MAKKLTVAEAQLVLQLYDLRREAELRKARAWWLGEFWPQDADDYLKVLQAGGPENGWLRQVASYWSMAASFALHGAIDAEYFLQPAVSGEMVFVFAKVHPFLQEMREKLGDPHSYGNIEKVIMSSKFGRDRLKLTLKRVEAMRARRKAGS
ncbi:MAG TPA: hypothetical protein VIW68_12310 [Candidatus Sulfotelmatobacter sp.]